MSTVEGYLEYIGDVHYIGGYHEYTGGHLEYIPVFSTLEGYHEYPGRFHDECWGIS